MLPLPTDDLRIKTMRELSSPATVIREIPRSDRATATVTEARQALHRILHGRLRRLVPIGTMEGAREGGASRGAGRLAGMRRGPSASPALD